MYAKIKTMLINVEIKPFHNFVECYYEKVVSRVFFKAYNHNITNENERSSNDKIDKQPITTFHGVLT